MDDVAKPGKTPADATARPIITGHSVLKDPMVNEADDQELPTEEAPKPLKAPSAANKVIQPLAKPDEKSNDVEKSTEPKADEPEPKTSSDGESDEAVVDAVLDQVTDKKAQEKLDAETQKRNELVDQLVAEKKYFVPINSVRRRRNNRIAVIILGSLLPLIVGLGLAADAGAVNLGFKLPFDFIKDTTSQGPTSATQATVQPAPTTKTYSDKTKGLSFEYPIEWGDVNISKGVYPKTLQGTYYRITFSKNATLFGALQTKDFISNNKATDPITFYPTGSRDYDTTVAGMKSIDAMRGKPRAKTAAIPGVAVLKSNGEWMSFVLLCGPECSQPNKEYIIGSIHKLDTTDFSAVSFGYTDAPALPNGITYLGLMEHNADSITKLIDQNKLGQLEKFTASIKSIKQ
jgi:hypothetical protein